MKLKRPLYGPGVYDGPSRDTDVLMMKRALGKTEVERLPKPAGGYDDVYNARVVEACQIGSTSIAG